MLSHRRPLFHLVGVFWVCLDPSISSYPKYAVSRLLGGVGQRGGEGAGWVQVGCPSRS